MSTDITGRTVHQLDRSGLVRDWLAGPVWGAPVTDLAELVAAEGSPWGADGRWVLTNGPDVIPLKTRMYQRHPLVADQPLPEVTEHGEVRWAAPWGGTDVGRWHRVHTGWDGLVDWSRFCHTPEYQHSVAAVYLEVDQAERRTLEVSAAGPFRLWVGDELVRSDDQFSYMEPRRTSVEVRLESGLTRVVLATWQVAFRECRHVAALRVHGLPVRVVLPSAGADEYLSATGEQVLDTVGVWPWALTEDAVTLTGPVDAELLVTVRGGEPRPVRLTEGSARIPIERPDAAAGQHRSATMLNSGVVDIEVGLADPRIPTVRRFQAGLLPKEHRDQPRGADPAVWTAELFRHAAAGPPSVVRALASAVTDPEFQLGADDLAGALDLVDQRGDCADFEAVGLLHLWHRVPAQRWAPGLREKVRAALCGLKYWIDQPGLDVMCYFTENHQLVWHTAELLAGEAFDAEKFANTGWTGHRHAQHGQDMAMAWIRRKLAGGFSEFDSNAYLAIDVLALASLLEFARDVEIRRLAEVLLDKMLLTLAANSARGVHGAAHGRTYTTTLRSARFEETGPIMWAMWGTGVLNSALLPAVVLATADRYRLPPLIRKVATEPGREWSGRQVYRGQLADRLDLLGRPYGSDMRVWRTPEVMLASVADYRSGLPGLQEHIWGVTLSPEAQIFATHPAADARGPSVRPNAWAGQRVLPRARQHRDAVLVVHRLPDGDPVGTTHLWFPLPHLDEHRMFGPWLAGRLGDGYVGVAVEGGLRGVRHGEEARQRWLPAGRGEAYVVTVGNARLDGDFAAFCARLAQHPPEFATDPTGTSAVSWCNRAGEVLELGWSTAFLVDGRCPDLDGAGQPVEPPHLDNPACRLGFADPRLVAEWQGERMVLDLAEGVRREPASRAEDVPR